ITFSGALRTLKFDIESSDDISLSGKTYGFGVGAGPGGATGTSGDSVFITSDGTEEGEEGQPFFSGSTVSIKPGTPVYIGR
ncbi:MAG: hypothetical protein RIQ56_435, partial [Candidatus Parcubacteria bacterium]